MEQKIHKEPIQNIDRTRKMFSLESCTYHEGEYVHPIHGSISKEKVVSTIDEAHQRGVSQYTSDEYVAFLSQANPLDLFSYEKFASVSIAASPPSSAFPLEEILMLANEHHPGIMNILYNPRDYTEFPRIGCEGTSNVVNLEGYILSIPEGDLERRFWFFLMLGLDIIHPVFLSRCAFTIANRRSFGVGDSRKVSRENLMRIFSCIFDTNYILPCDLVEMMTKPELIEREGIVCYSCLFNYNFHAVAGECKMCTYHSQCIDMHPKTYNYVLHCCTWREIYDIVHISYQFHIIHSTLFSRLFLFVRGRTDQCQGHC